MVQTISGWIIDHIRKIFNFLKNGHKDIVKYQTVKMRTAMEEIYIPDISL